MKTKNTVKNTTEINFSEIRKEGWKISRTDGKALTFLLIRLIIYAISYAIGFVFGFTSGIFGFSDSVIFDEFMNVLWYVLEILSTIGIISVGFDLINGIDANVKDYFKAYTWDRIWKVLLGTILVSIISALGFVCLIIPGIIVTVRLKFTLFAIIDKGLDPIEAIKYSRNITKGHFREIIGFDLYLALFNILGFLCLLIGLIRTVTMTQLARTRYYKLLSGIYEGNNMGNNKSK